MCVRLCLLGTSASLAHIKLFKEASNEALALNVSVKQLIQGHINQSVSIDDDEITMKQWFHGLQHTDRFLLFKEDNHVDRGLATLVGAVEVFKMIAEVSFDLARELLFDSDFDVVDAVPQKIFHLIAHNWLVDDVDQREGIVVCQWIKQFLAKCMENYTLEGL